MRGALLTRLTTPPPRRPPPPKYPLFTKDPFSTKSFGPGHVVGAGIFVLGFWGLSKLFAARGQSETRAPAQTPRPPRLAAENDRGQYGQQGTP